jgi:NADH pyrophosphatase NudC (nudix superfamily)
MQREIATINPDPAYFRSFPDAQVMVNGRAAERVLLAERAYAPASPDEEEEELSDTTGENPVPLPFMPPQAFRPVVAKAADRLADHQCEYCGGVLPSNREARFCPHCGQPQEGQLKCPGCGAELDVGWAYCLSCGRATGFE